MSSGSPHDLLGGSTLNNDPRMNKKVNFDSQIATGSAYEANSNIDIGGRGVFKHSRNIEQGDKNYFDEYLYKLHKQKHSLMIEEEHRELNRVDQSLLNMIRQIDHRNIGDLEALHDTPTLPSKNDYKLQRYLEQKEYEKKMLEMKLELREDQIRQLMDVIKSSGRLDSGLSPSLNNSTGDENELPNLRMEIEQLKRLSAKLNAEIQMRDEKMEATIKQSNIKDNTIDKLTLEIETIRKRGRDRKSVV